MIWRWFKRGLLGLLVLVLGLLAPVGYVELACRGADAGRAYTSPLPAEHRRSEARTLMTYPEWHIVHAYDDYAEVISNGDPHHFGFLQAIASFWTTTCALTEASASHGGVDGQTKQMVYVIGVSFTAELLAKAAYEETIGRLFAMMRGATRAPLDALSAEQARGYAAFLQQIPWYRWDFRADRAALDAAATNALRDRERRIALGLEYGAKAAYAEVIASAVAATGADALRLRMIVSGVTQEVLTAQDDVQIIAARADGLEIETPRYRQLTGYLADWASAGAAFVDIAGNDDILLTATSSSPTHPGALASFARQGYGDYRHLILLKVSDLGETLRNMAAQGLTLEHVHDY
ncbi:hypothetical protein [Primorskyibacter sp. S187A]|uniref:hypothetical protein n=1 Tax=Primorskyibacter sp. S187A TaxID=3415130 RepID=UPI003C7D2EDF